MRGGGGGHRGGRRGGGKGGRGRNDRGRYHGRDDNQRRGGRGNDDRSYDGGGGSGGRSSGQGHYGPSGGGGQSHYGRSGGGQGQYDGGQGHYRGGPGYQSGGQGQYGGAQGSSGYGGRGGSSSYGGRGGYHQRDDNRGGGSSSYGGRGGYQLEEGSYQRGGGRSGYQGRGRRGGGCQGRGRGRGGRGGRGKGPDLSGLESVLSNIVLAKLTDNFQFYLYSVNCIDANGDLIDSRHRRKFLFDVGFWDGHLKDVPENEKSDWKRVVFFSGSFFFSSRPIPGLESNKLPLTLDTGSRSEGDTIEVRQAVHYLSPVDLKLETETLISKAEIKLDKRCANCTKAFQDVGALLQHCQSAGHKPVYDPLDEKPAVGDDAPKVAPMGVFLAYVNGALNRALSERLARWGSEFIDPANVTEPVDRQGNSLGVRVYEAFSCQFGMLRPSPESPARLSLTVDLRAKIVRTMSVLDHLTNGRPHDWKPNHSERDRARRAWVGEVVISMHDKKCYSVTDLLFDHSAASMPVEGLGMSHAEYFEQRKNINLNYPNAIPMIAVLGRRNQTIYLPPELVAGNELERRVKEQLPMIASYKPEARNSAIDKIRGYLIAGKQKTKGASGLLPALGIVLDDGRLQAKTVVLSLPRMLATGLEVPKSRAENWAPLLGRASFNVNPKEAVTLNVILFHSDKLKESGVQKVYDSIKRSVNNFNATYRFSERPYKVVRAGDNERHWGAVERCLSQDGTLPENMFVLDFTKPRGGSDPAYPVIKQMLTQNGYLSQFVNFITYAHDNPRDEKRSNIILQGVARQIIQKTGVRLWWVAIPRSLPTPAVFIGVDVFHAPVCYDPVAKKRVAKASCAAIVVQVVRGDQQSPSNKIELYSQTYAREPGKEYELGDALKATVSNALRELKVDPMSCIVWRDGIGDSAFDHAATEEIAAIRAGLNGVGAVGESRQERNVPLSYIVCQKRIATKFLTSGVPGEPDGKYGAPSGTLVQSLQGLEHNTFYINGRAPPYSTPKPVRFIVVNQDNTMEQVPLPNLTWDLCHDYPNWTGPIKVPSVCQMAHKLAELGGGFADCGRNIHSSKLANTVHFL